MIDTAWSGESFSTRVWGNTEELARRIRGEAQEMVMGLKSPATVKQQLMKDHDVSFRQASRLVDTELSYVLNKANLEEYRRRGRKKLTITNLDVKAASPGLAGFAKGETADGSNRRFEARHLYTCDKCKALEGEVFFTEDVPVLPIHPRCHCAYCAPDDLDDAEVTASGEDLDSVYARKGVKGYGEDAPKQYVPKQQRAAEVARANGLIPASELQAKVEKAMAQTAPELAEGVRKTVPANVENTSQYASMADDVRKTEAAWFFKDSNGAGSGEDKVYAYGEKAKTVDMEYIRSKAYREKYSGITGDAKVDRKIYKAARTILKHRS